MRRAHLTRVTIAVGGAMVAAAACAPPAGTPATPPGTVVALSGGPNASMAYLARVSTGVIAIDLGWWGGERSMREALVALGASPDDVTDVFLTHSHRDHVGAWRLVRRSQFHLAAPEEGTFVGERRHRGWIPRVVESMKSSDMPRRGEIDLRTFSRDTTFTFGRDTLHAFLVPGHTAGSVAYLVRGVLLLGDAATYTPWGGFAPARRGFSDDADVAVRSLDALWARLQRSTVRSVCTAHAKCAPLTPALLADIKR